MLLQCVAKLMAKIVIRGGTCPVMLWQLCCTKEGMKMLIDYPMEWRKYMIKGKTRTFSENTPQEIVEKVKELNKKAIRDAGKPFFFFEENR